MSFRELSAVSDFEEALDQAMEGALDVGLAPDQIETIVTRNLRRFLSECRWEESERKGYPGQ